MSHRHWCDYTGHFWECVGSALRPLAGDLEPSACFCLTHRVSMEEGDHRECPIEFLDCLDHREAQLREMGLSDARDRPNEEALPNSTCFELITHTCGHKRTYSRPSAEALRFVAGYAKTTVCWECWKLARARGKR
jgi:hypothetical protein